MALISDAKIINITNKLGSKKTLIVHCESVDDDLGALAVNSGDVYHWDFEDSSLFRQVVFWCRLALEDGRLSFVAYIEREDGGGYAVMGYDVNETGLYGPNIVRCLDDDCSFERGQNLHNLFLGGSLRSHQESCRRLPKSVVKSYKKSILKGLDHIHDIGFIHCDVKLQNVLMFENGEVKIEDFKLAMRTGGEEKVKPGRKVEIRGTPLFMAPESINSNVYKPPCNISDLGCAVIEMLTRTWICKSAAAATLARPSSSC
ncbi:unnamed protein product [Linum tenue]|uniref:Protein kinase domain-containing protein n=1 Tax=Linum tenue TaxID=586396 RepID=A0AAV0KMI9_9ROSI|nr:unnamed protein product [Linum tenue]